MAANLFVCDTPFHVFTALVLVKSRLLDDVNDFILTDNMVGAYNLAETLSISDYADSVFVAKAKHNDGNAFYGKMGYLCDLLLPFSWRWACPMTNRVYDALYVRNFMNPIVVAAYSYFKIKNEHLLLIAYDEGYSSYSREFWFDSAGSFLHRVAGFIARGLFRKRGTFADISQALLFAPDLLDFELPFPVLPLIPSDFRIDRYFVSEINRIFSFDPVLFGVSGCDETSLLLASKSSNRKFIFFEESFATDWGNNSDLRMLEDIARIVGKENVVVKLHPRSTDDRFTPLGYSVMGGISCPWEVCALNAPKDCELTLISFSSGSLLNYHFFSEHTMRSVFLYKLYPDACQSMSDDVRRFFAGFLERYPDRISVPTTRSELMESLS